MRAYIGKALVCSERTKCFTHLDVTLPSLNLGAGCVTFQGENCENHDGQPRAHVDHVFDLLGRWPLDTSKYGIVYAFHVFEHLPVDKLLHVLSETQRVLLPSGVLIAEMPDSGGLLKKVLSEDPGHMRDLFGGDRFPGDAHRWMYTAETFSTLLYAAGFWRVICCEPKWYLSDQLPCFRVEAVNGHKVQGVCESDDRVSESGADATS